MFLSSVEEHISLSQMNKNAGVWRFSGFVTPAAGEGHPSRSLPHPCLCLKTKWDWDSCMGRDKFSGLSDLLKRIQSLCCDVRSKRDHSVINHGTACKAAFRQSFLITCDNLLLLCCHFRQEAQLSRKDPRDALRQLKCWPTVVRNTNNANRSRVSLRSTFSNCYGRFILLPA